MIALAADDLVLHKRAAIATREAVVEAILRGDVIGNEDDLAGSCAFASLCLRRVLVRLGVKTVDLVITRTKFGQHVWVEDWSRSPSIAIDITASQFNANWCGENKTSFGAVYIGQRPTTPFHRDVTHTSRRAYREVTEKWACMASPCDNWHLRQEVVNAALKKIRGK